MDLKTKELLKEIGSDLDLHQFPSVYPGGFVKPGNPADLILTAGQEKEDERKRRSKTRQGQRPSRRQRSAYRPWSACQTAPVICPSLQRLYRAEIDAVRKAFPKTKVWYQPQGMWLLIESGLFEGLGKKASFLIAIPFTYYFSQKSWGFWTTSVSSQWIGPKHTNYPDGSVCAFEPKDGTWRLGDPLIDLLNIYTLWALRHLSREQTGRWPGYQSVHHPFERLTELRDDEFCGCNHSSRLYKDCCKQVDLSLDRKTILNDFLRRYQGGVRKPPTAILDFMVTGNTPPPIRSISSPSSTVLKIRLLKRSGSKIIN